MANSTNKKRYRCAIYTRKSHEEGLEQDFNSLDAQREAAEAYIKSQQHEGWQTIATPYDDGGFTGANTKRPALTQLIDDIKQNAIDIVVVYKVDRLSRSLADFSNLIQLFDEHSVSFVSVTQQFNTSNSMGRLTLNVLLSFAQFEREVTSERIRDKIAASKKKGLWMGGRPPLGYDCQDRNLIPNPEEQKIVTQIFHQYLQNNSLLKMAESLNRQSITTKKWISQKGHHNGGTTFNPKHLYRILTNPIYIGKITHKDKTYAGQHPAIIDPTIWEQVQQIIHKKNPVIHTQKTPFLLKSKLRHYEGYAMSPTHVYRYKTVNDEKQRQKVRYYVSQKAIQHGYKQCDIKSINAEHLESIVRSALYQKIEQQTSTSALKLFLNSNDSDRQQQIRQCLQTVTLAPDKLNIEINRQALDNLCLQLQQHLKPDIHDVEAPPSQQHHPKLHYIPQVQKNKKTLLLTLHIQIKKSDGKRWILSSKGKDIVIDDSATPNPVFTEAFGRGYHWRQQLENNSKETAKSFARKHHINYNTFLYHLNLTTLSPDIQYQALFGKLPERISLKQLFAAAQILDWKQQAGFLRI